MGKCELDPLVNRLCFPLSTHLRLLILPSLHLTVSSIVHVHHTIFPRTLSLPYHLSFRRRLDAHSIPKSFSCLNGVADRYHMSSPRWPLLEPNQNTVREKFGFVGKTCAEEMPIGLFKIETG